MNAKCTLCLDEGVDSPFAPFLKKLPWASA